MPMSAAALATELLNLVPAATEAAAIITLVDAYGAFASDVQAGSAAITAAGVALGKAAMQAALVGVSAPGAGSAVLTAAVQAFWAAVAGGLAASFAGAIAVVPPPHAGLQVLLDATFISNTAAAADLADATQAVATDLYNQVIIGGTVTQPGPVVSPIL